MKAVTISKTGGPEVLELKEINLGKPGPDEVLIEHAAIGLNYYDHAKELNFEICNQKYSGICDHTILNNMDKIVVI